MTLGVIVLQGPYIENSCGALMKTRNSKYSLCRKVQTSTSHSIDIQKSSKKYWSTFNLT